VHGAAFGAWAGKWGVGVGVGREREVGAGYLGGALSQIGGG
jgi:hypothetical protein